MAKKRKKADESHGEIAWESAEVSKGSLTVELEGDVSKAWSERVAAILDRLGQSSHWGDVEVSRKKITVAAVSEGHEADLRHVLEGAVQQANADFAPAPDDDEAAGDGASAEDQSMTASFRAFADDADDD